MKTKLIFLLVAMVAGPVVVSRAQPPEPTPTPVQAETAPPVTPPPATQTPPPTATATATVVSTNAGPAPEPFVPPTSNPVMLTTNTPPSPGDEVAESLAFDDLPLPDAIRQLAALAGLNIQFDYKLENQVDPTTHQPLPFPTVKEKWRNLTPKQALTALLKKYDWQMVTDPNTPVISIVKREGNIVEPPVVTVHLLAYSDPSNIVSEVRSLFKDVTIIPDIRTHQVTISAPSAVMPNVEKLVTQLDRSTGQILIEAKIIETTRDITSDKGVDWTGTLQSQHVSFGNGLTGGTVTQTTQTGNGTGTTVTAPGGRTATGNPVTSIMNTSSSFITTTTGAASSAGGLTLNTAQGFNPKTAFLNADGASAILSWLNSDADTKSIAFPRTVSLDGRKTVLSVVQNVPIFEQTQSTPAAGASQGLATVVPNYNKSVGDTILNEVGTKLTVVPRIAGTTNVLIAVQPEISSVDTKIATDTLNGQVNTSPIFDRRSIITEASVPSGYTLVLGGLDDDVMAKTYTKVPGLGDLPGVGQLFRSDGKNHTRDTILIFVTPTIIQDSDFQNSPTDFLKSKNEPMPTAKDSAWDTGKPYDWSKPKSPVQPVYQP